MQQRDIQPGMKVNIKEGPYEGFIGKVLGQKIVDWNTPTRFIVELNDGYQTIKLDFKAGQLNRVK